MASSGSFSGLQKRSISLRTTLGSRRKRLEEEGSRSDDEAAASAPDHHHRQQPSRRCSPRSHLETFDEIPIVESPNTASHINSSLRGREPRSSPCAREVPPRTGRDSAVGSPSRGDLSSTHDRFDTNEEPIRSLIGPGSSATSQDSVLEDSLLRNHANPILYRTHTRSQAARPQPEASTLRGYNTDAEVLGYAFDDFDSDNFDRASRANTFERLELASADPFGRIHHTMAESSKRTGERLEGEAGNYLLNTLKKQGAVTAMMYHDTIPDPEANDIWPSFRSTVKLPVRYSVLDTNANTPGVDELGGGPQRATQDRYDLRERVIATCPQKESRNNSKEAGSAVPSSSSATDIPRHSPSKGRPFWQLPVELVEHIMEHLNRDDIKSLRLVSRELNDFTSEAAFNTVVVPFNIEIYGMLGQEPKPDRKGKKRARLDKPEYWWKNGHGDEAYIGHGLDVFRGFGRHIVRYAMSFEVTEDSLSAPPLKSVTEQKTSFWGRYEWPFEEYRRFDAIAGLESAADETPRMTTAFSELTKVKELALSIDCGLGWLNGPDRSIRAHVLQKPLSIFGSRREIPDRRAQAQRELWDHIDTMHARVGEDVRVASLYRLEGVHPLTQAHDTSLLATVQPTLPFLDAHIMHEAKPHDMTDSDFSHPLENTDLLDRHMLGPYSTNAGVLFTSTTLQPSDAAEVTSSITPATLARAQKEWLLETEWAQRAFMSSYMLSIIDNPVTFHQIHTLNISSLPDRYIHMLNRADFWTALPDLKSVTLMVVPSWRTVYKDEAGFVATFAVDPTERVDVFYELLLAQITLRPTIKKLTVGFTTGGEHAEGLHARNKLLMPAPLLPLKACMPVDPLLATVETVLIQDANILQQALLRFPHLEELTLRNCWVTPSALLEFVKIHDECSLKHLIMDSVSLTAILRPIGTAHVAPVVQQANPQNAVVAQQLAGTLWNLNNNGGVTAAPAHHLPASNQVLNLYIQSLIVQLQQMQANAGGMQQQHINALQNQLQQQLQTTQIPNPQPRQGLTQYTVQPHPQAQQQLNITHMAHLNHLATQVSSMQQLGVGQGGLVTPSTNAPVGGSKSVLQMQPREGSWMDIIDQISPGTNLSDFESAHSQANPARTTSLQCVSFVSCGYAKLPHLVPRIDQSSIEMGNGFVAALRNPVFTKRYNALSSVMLSSRWPYLGEIVQEVDFSEISALDAAWSFRHGWDDAEAARAVEFDGLLSGGTGRFTGKVQCSDRINTGTESASA